MPPVEPALESASEQGQPIRLPLFDEQRHNLEQWLGWLDTGCLSCVRKAIRKTLPVLRRVRGSRRHAQLADYLRCADDALDTGEPQAARYILLNALLLFE